MARTISEEELQLKRRARRRLIGAIVLVAAIVVVLPMVLDSEPRQSGQAVSVQIPGPDAGVFAPKIAPLPAAPKAAPDQPPVVKESQKAAATPSPAKETPQAIPEKTPPPVVKAEPEKPVAARTQTKPAARSGGQYVVQVIALADAGKAKQMQQTIATAGIKSYTEVVKTAKGDVTRVRAGPFASRADAEKAREQLKALGMNGNITTR